MASCDARALPVNPAIYRLRGIFRDVGNAAALRNLLIHND